jgi:hypothetical protein
MIHTLALTILIKILLYQNLNTTKVFKALNPSPQNLSKNDPALILNMSQNKTSHNPFIVTREPKEQIIGTSTVEELVKQRQTNQFMSFDKCLSFGVWMKLADDFKFTNSVSFIEFYFSKVVSSLKFLVSNSLIVDQKNLEVDAFKKVNVAIRQDQWVYVFLQYYADKVYRSMEVKINDETVYVFKESTDLFKDLFASSVLVSLGTTDFRIPIVSE